MPLATSNISLENPAPNMITSIPASIEACTRSIKLVVAYIIFTPNAPPLFTIISLALLISFFSSSIDNAVPAITPIPPSFATAAASFAIDALIAIPP